MEQRCVENDVHLISDRQPSSTTRSDVCYDISHSHNKFFKNKLFPSCVDVAIYIPPKQEQAFNQGGAFLFDGDETAFAHYDESTGAHCDIQQVIDLANQRVIVREKVLL